MMKHLRAFASVLLLSALGAVGCSDASFESGADDEGSGVVEGQVRLVSDALIDMQRADSPEQELLIWWLAVQRQDRGRVVERTARETVRDVGEEELRAFVPKGAARFEGIRLLAVEVHPETASVLAVVRFDGVSADQGLPPGQVRFTMALEDGSWKFASTDYLQDLVDGTKKAVDDARD